MRRQAQLAGLLVPLLAGCAFRPVSRVDVGLSYDTTHEFRGEDSRVSYISPLQGVRLSGPDSNWTLDVLTGQEFQEWDGELSTRTLAGPSLGYDVWIDGSLIHLQADWFVFSDGTQSIFLFFTWEKVWD